MIDDQIVDLANPEAIPAYLLYFIKNRGGLGVNCTGIIFDGGRYGWGELSGPEKYAAKSAMDEFNVNGTEVVYLNENYEVLCDR
ncbi:MAG: hypothetical protein GF411_08635 [Candidatus Lokiarchaeota archaeon]|nr:hypothetical protein [Candidatus Lokiarchaeota archaeon]